MISKITLAAAAALTLASLPASAHKMELAGGKNTWDSQQTMVNGCPYFTSEWNMAQIESTFRAMPQSSRMNIQHMMRHAGLYGGADDGIWGEKTACGISAIAGRLKGTMRDKDMISFFEYMLDGGFMHDYDGNPSPSRHIGILY